MVTVPVSPRALYSRVSRKGWGGVARATETRKTAVTTRKNTTHASSEHQRSSTDSHIHPRTGTGRVISFSLSETHTNHTRRSPSLLATTSGGRMPAESHAQLEPKVSIAAGMTATAQGQPEYGPARTQAAHVSARADGHERARVERRTGEEGGHAQPKTRFLVGLARPLRRV